MESPPIDDQVDVMPASEFSELAAKCGFAIVGKAGRRFRPDHEIDLLCTGVPTSCLLSLVFAKSLFRQLDMAIQHAIGIRRIAPVAFDRNIGLYCQRRDRVRA